MDRIIGVISVQEVMKAIVSIWKYLLQHRETGTEALAVVGKNRKVLQQNWNIV